MKHNFVFSMLGGFFLTLLVMNFTSSADALSVDRPAVMSQSHASIVNAPAAVPISATFTYQGQLKNRGVPVTGSCGMAFRLYDDVSAGNLIGSPITLTVPVVNGLFTVQLDDRDQFGANAFTGSARWLEIAVQCTGDSNPTILSRQQLTAAPYALYATSAGALQGRPVTTTAPSSGQVLKWDGSTWSPGTDNTGGAGGPFWSLTGNSGANPTTNFLGTTDNMTLTFRVSNTVAYRIVPAVHPNFGFAPNLIGGSGTNNVAPGLYGATIGGGGVTLFPNVISGTGNFATVSGGILNFALKDSATIGGGVENIADGNDATVGGGFLNTASGEEATVGGGFGNQANGFIATIGGGNQNSTAGQYATVGGGTHNSASGAGAFVGGGGFNGTNSAGNTASGIATTVGGGYDNRASGNWATIPGGFGNGAAMTYTLAAGRRAQANHDGAFVWGDSTDADIHSSGKDQFIVRANGGIAFVTATVDFTPTLGAGVFITTSTRAYLSTGGMWTNASDKNLKANFAPVDARNILARVSSLPVQTWNYRAEDANVRHIGPTAQDFYAAFNVGRDDTSIGTVDADGVALAAIQGLYQENQDLNARIAALEQANPNAASPWSSLASNLPTLIAAVIIGFVIGRRLNKGASQ